MSTLKRGNSWYIDFRFERTRYRKKSPDNSKAGAKAYEVVLRRKLSQGEPIVQTVEMAKQIPTFAVFSKEWLASYVETNNKYSEILNKRTILNFNLIPYFGKTALDCITARSVEEYKALKIKSGLKNKSINNHLSCLRKCLSIAQEWEILEHVPRIKLLKVPPPETISLSHEDSEKLLAATSGNWHDMIFTVLRTGLRFGELIALNWSDIDFERKIITVQRSIARGKIGGTKSNKIRKIPLAEDLAQLLRTKRRNGKFVFADTNGEILRQDFCRTKILRFAKQADVRIIGWHTLRHTFASHLANNGVAVQVIQALLGHSDIKTTMRYSHIAPTTLVEAIDTLERSSPIFWTQGGHKNGKTEIQQLLKQLSSAKILA